MNIEEQEQKQSIKWWKQKEQTKATSHVSIHGPKRARGTSGGFKNENKDEINVHIWHIVKTKQSQAKSKQCQRKQ